jgi:hypothetical protein
MNIDTLSFLATAAAGKQATDIQRKGCHRSMTTVRVIQK